MTQIIVLFLFFLIISIVGIGIYFFWKKNNQKQKLFPLLMKRNNTFLSFIFLGISVFFLSFFLLFSGEPEISNSNLGGGDVIFTLDVSKSMNVADMKQKGYMVTRLDFAKQSIIDFIIKNPENRYGLVIFSGDAISTVPLTNDKNIFLTLLENVDYRNLTKQGSDFETAISLSKKRFYEDEQRNKHIIMLTDGGDAGDNISIKKTRNKQNISFTVLGIGTTKGGKIITGQDVFGRIQYQRYRGNYVESKLYKKNIKEIAKKIGANYIFPTSTADIKNIELKTKSSSKSVDIVRGVFTTESKNILSVFAWLSFISFCLFLISLVVDIPYIGKIGIKK